MGEAGSEAEAADRARVRGEFRGLWRTQGLAAYVVCEGFATLIWDRLVRQSPAAGADRQHAASRSRGTLSRDAGRATVAASIKSHGFGRTRGGSLWPVRRWSTWPLPHFTVALEREPPGATTANKPNNQVAVFWPSRNNALLWQCLWFPRSPPRLSGDWPTPWIRKPVCGSSPIARHLSTLDDQPYLNGRI